MTTQQPNEQNNPVTSPDMPEPDSGGSVIKGVLLNVGINLFICLIWIPLCSGGSSGGGDDIATILGVIFFFGMFWIGLAQLVHIIPMAIYLGVKQQQKTLRGVLWAALVTFIAWGIFMLVFTF